MSRSAPTSSRSHFNGVDFPTTTTIIIITVTITITITINTTITITITMYYYYHYYYCYYYYYEPSLVLDQRNAHIRFAQDRKELGSIRFGLRFSDASWLGPVRFDCFLRPFPAGSRT